MVTPSHFLGSDRMYPHDVLVLPDQAELLAGSREIEIDSRANSQNVK